MNKKTRANWDSLVEICKTHLLMPDRQSMTIWRGQMRAIVDAEAELRRTARRLEDPR